jgi:hypothetical protein
MVRRIAIATMVICALYSFSAYAEDGGKPLVGSWKLTSWVLQVVGESSREPFGPNAKGRLVITAGGEWIIILTGSNRHPAKTTEDKAALLDSVLAYSGKYTVEGDKITTRVDVSANEVYSGANQVQSRFFKVEGDKLTINTGEIVSAAIPGKRVVATLTFERER